MEIEGRQFSNRLKKYRKLRGLKQETVRKKLRLSSRSFLSDLENGKEIPSLSRLCELAKLYRCRPADLYPELDKIPESPSEGENYTKPNEKPKKEK
jgi:transcriptional regulator with XRE-family HTH domain